MVAQVTQRTENITEAEQDCHKFVLQKCKRQLTAQ